MLQLQQFNAKSRDLHLSSLLVQSKWIEQEALEREWSVWLARVGELLHLVDLPNAKQCAERPLGLSLEGGKSS